MYIIFFIIIFVIAGFLVKGLFDPKWRANAQEKFDSLRREKKFWYLMNTEDTINDEPGEKNTGGLNVRDVFRLYVFSLARELLVGDFSRRKEIGYNNLDKSIISQKAHWVDNINLLRKKIDEKEKDIEQFFKDNEVNLTKSDIQKGFEKADEESWGFSEEMKKLVSSFLRLVEEKSDGNQIWTAMKKFEEVSRNYEFDSAGNNIKDLNMLVSIKMGQFQILETITNLLYEKIKAKENSLKLQKLLQEREQMEMLQWCLINYSVTWLNTNGIQRFGWRLANSLFL